MCIAEGVLAVLFVIGLPVVVAKCSREVWKNAEGIEAHWLKLRRVNGMRLDSEAILRGLSNPNRKCSNDTIPALIANVLVLPRRGRLLIDT